VPFRHRACTRPFSFPRLFILIRIVTLRAAIFRLPTEKYPMNDIDGNDVQRNSSLEADLCIIGGGAAGMAIARQFIDTNKKVILIESGAHSYNDKTQALYEFNNIGHPVRAQKGYISRNRYLGGSTNTWHDGCLPLNPVDFEQRSWVPNSGWPIKYEDLELYYRDAAGFLKLPEYDNFSNKRWRGYIKAAPANFLENASGLEPEIFLFANKPLNTRLAYAKSIKRSANVRILLNSNVTRLETIDNQSVLKLVHIGTLGGNKFCVKATNYILACGGWENARLLLVSRGPDGKGLGNYHDNVGRYYNEHPKIIQGKIVPTDKSLLSPIMIWKRRINYKGYMRVSMKLSAEIQKEHRLLNHYIQPIYPQSFREAISHSDAFIRKFNFSKDSIHRLAKLSSSLLEYTDAFERILFNMPLRFDSLGVVSHFEQIPNRESRISLSCDKDALGLNKLDVKLIVSTEEKDNMIRYHKVLDAILQGQNLGRLESGFGPPDADWPNLTDSSHHIGTTRMSNDPKEGVVDKDCKVHGVANLFIASSSVFPTGGHVNPTLSIVAIALRLASHLKKKILL